MRRAEHELRKRLNNVRLNMRSTDQKANEACENEDWNELDKLEDFLKKLIKEEAKIMVKLENM